MLTSLLLPILRERFPDRGLAAGGPDELPVPCAVFPGLHPGIRQVAIYDDGDELTVCVEELTHCHFDEDDDTLSEGERAGRIVGAVVEFLDDLFADRVVVWCQPGVAGGWYRPGLGGASGRDWVQEFVWSGPRA